MSKDCCNPKDNKTSGKGRIDPFLIIVSATTIVILAGVVYFGSKQGAVSQVSPDSEVSLSVDSKNHDWGAVDYDGGIVSKSFIIKNTGNSALKLYDVKTSCMCTTARLKTPEAESKRYAMHEKSADIFEVGPNVSAEIIVEYDPAFHGPSGVGPISRTVTVSTNDTKNPRITFDLTANVVKN